MPVISPRPPRVLVLELLASGPGRGWYERYVKLPNFFGVMAQAVAVWCAELGSEVEYRTYTGNEAPQELLEGEWDVVMLSSSTRTAWTAYAIAHCFRSRGATTVLGGPHAMAWPDDARRHFDYVLGFTGRELIRRVLEERRPAGGSGGQWLADSRHPDRLPGLRARARFARAALAKSRILHSVPLLGSLGCPYTCEFCSDAETGYQPLDQDAVLDDLVFARSAYPGALLFWHDPNFGVRFDIALDVIEQAQVGARLRFGAESTLSLLAPDRLERLARAGFVAMLPGIESWFGYSRKLGLGGLTGREKVFATAKRVNQVLAAIPYVQINLIVGLEGENTDESSELTRSFLALAPGVWPNLNLATAYGAAAPLSRRVAREGRLLPVPFPLIDQKTLPNVAGEAPALANLLLSLSDLLEHAFGWGATLRRVKATHGAARWLNLARGRSREQHRRIAWYRQLAHWLVSDRAVAAFFEGRSTRVPDQLRDEALRRIGAFAELLPPGAAVT